MARYSVTFCVAVLSLQCLITSAIRESLIDNKEDSKATNEVRIGQAVAAGQLLEGRFLLHSFIERREFGHWNHPDRFNPSFGARPIGGGGRHPGPIGGGGRHPGGRHPGGRHPRPIGGGDGRWPGPVDQFGRPFRGGRWPHPIGGGGRRPQPQPEPQPGPLSHAKFFVMDGKKWFPVEGEPQQGDLSMDGQFWRPEGSSGPRPSQGHPAEKPKQQFPASIQGYEGTSEHLGAGNFGDVWKAFDQKLGKEVAIKIFYSRKTGREEYLTWMTANQKEREDLMTNVAECDLVKGLMKNQNIDPIGAQRICQCYEERVSMKKNTNEVTFLVLELCGESLTKRRQKLAALTGESRVAAARAMTKQVLEAVSFLQIHQPPLIHHDMKLDNAVVDGSIESPSVRLIDFGCHVWATPQGKVGFATGDSMCMPPEFKHRQAFMEPAYSFDIYGVGLMHMQLLCPSQDVRDWFQPGKPVRMSDVERSLYGRCHDLRGLIREDLKLIASLTRASPESRLDPQTAVLTPSLCHSGSSTAPEKCLPVSDSPYGKTTQNPQNPFGHRNPHVELDFSNAPSWFAHEVEAQDGRKVWPM
eukprot:TRINITY_DN2019_c0_g1_i2.p1 TRINITY_DN2019_c0_g1~~TRINITY_DN2019_c0_g1_i2.p1  ORF type:complete len:609 (+),score=83.92 TRINITY_DN2019_c0_g1_i2:79-1827(+)